MMNLGDGRPQRSHSTLKNPLKKKRKVCERLEKRSASCVCEVLLTLALRRCSMPRQVSQMSRMSSRLSSRSILVEFGEGWAGERFELGATEKLDMKGREHLSPDLPNRGVLLPLEGNRVERSSQGVTKRSRMRCELRRLCFRTAFLSHREETQGLRMRYPFFFTERGASLSAGFPAQGPTSTTKRN